MLYKICLTRNIMHLILILLTNIIKYARKKNVNNKHWRGHLNGWHTCLQWRERSAAVCGKQGNRTNPIIRNENPNKMEWKNSTRMSVHYIKVLVYHNGITNTEQDERRTTQITKSHTSDIAWKQKLLVLLAKRCSPTLTRRDVTYGASLR